MAWYEDFFDDLGDDFDRVFARQIADTVREVDFVQQALDLRGGDPVLDVACGTGRHSVELARRGFAVTGLDRSAALLDAARARAAGRGVTVRWICADMRRPPLLSPQAGTICLFSSWGYFATDADNQRALAAMARVLRPRGRLVLEVLNDQWLRSSAPPLSASCEAGVVVVERRQFDPRRGRLESDWSVAFADGRRRRWTASCRIYTREQVEARMARAGLRVLATHGDFAGSPLSAESHRCILVAERVGAGSAIRPRG